jgi:four helix bundle protein
MEKRNPSQFSKPYDLRERLFEYACAIVYLVKDLHKIDAVSRSLADQVLRAGNSAGANYEEADDGSSPVELGVNWELGVV